MLLTNEIRRYAREYFVEERIVEPDEEVLPYYDDTVRLQGTRAAILTEQRLISHDVETSPVSIDLQDIGDIEHRQTALDGGVFAVPPRQARPCALRLLPETAARISPPSCAMPGSVRANGLTGVC